MLLALALVSLQATIPVAADLVTPADRWTTFGGNPARTASVATAPLRGPVAVAWTHDAGAEIVGEPLVWDELIVLELESGTNRRSLRFLDLLTGETVTPRDHSVTSELTLEPGLWRNEVLFRKSPTTISGLRMWRGRMYERWTHRTEGEVGPPVLVNREVYACVGDGVERMAWGKNSPVWRTEGPFRGRVSLHAESVVALRVGPGPHLHAVEMSRDSGEVLRTAIVGLASSSWTHAATSDATVTLLGDGWAVSAPPPLTLVPNNEVHGLIFDPWNPRSSQELIELPAGGLWTVPPALQFDAEGTFGWVGIFETGGASLEQSANMRLREVALLAGEEANADFALHRGGPTVLPGVTYVGPRAFDRYSKDVLWRQESKDVPTSRAVPARGSVLYVRNGTELVALRSAFRMLAESTAEDPIETRVALPEAVAGKLWLRDGSSREGQFSIQEAESRLVWTEKAGAEPETIQLNDVLAILDSSGQIVWAKTGRSLTRALRTRGDDLRAELLTEIALDSKKRRRPDLVEQLLERARQAGAESKKLDKLPEWIERVRKSKTKPKKGDEKQVALLLAEADLADAEPTKSLFEGYAALNESAPSSWRIALLRALLEEEPEAPKVVSLILELLPSELRPEKTEDFDGPDWLRFIEATYHAPVTLHQVPEESADLTFAQRQLGRASTLWREDVVAFESENLLVLTAVERPGAIARCLAFGELACDVLESIFSDERIEAERKERTARNPLVLYLYPTREEYMNREGGVKRGGEEGVGLSWSAGHYDEIDNVSRIYVPPGDDELDSVLRTYVHELTHHWLRVKCPLFTNAEARRDPRHPGFWIVEGFASMVEEFLLDPATQRWAAENPQSRRLDLVANTGDGQRIPWDALYEMTQLKFLTMPYQGELRLRSSTRLGIIQPASPRTLYYAQAAATARYLFLAEDGKYRGVLCDFLRDVYVGDKSDGLDICARIGLTPAELGERVLESAREAVGKN